MSLNSPLKLDRAGLIFIGRLIVGYFFLVLGVLGLILPIMPGWIFIFMALPFLDVEGKVAHRIVRFVPGKYKAKIHNILMTYVAAEHKTQYTGKRVVVGMSGGVDSSVALLLLKKQGYDPIGVSLKYAVWDDPCNMCENVCCSTKSFKIAEKICKSLGVEHHVINVSKDFEREVIDYFKGELRQGRTPSPCVFCNPNLKFKKLFEFADKVGAEYVATGHYAQVQTSSSLRVGVPGGVAISLKIAKDKVKDQTYSLSFLPQDYLKRIIFPLGNLTKTWVYKIARKNKGFEIFKKQKQSQDFCFVSGNAYPEFLKKEIGENKGPITDETGRKIGQHRGLHFYTIGQRKGIDLPGGPFYVVKKDIEKNALVVSKNEIKTKELALSPINLIGVKIDKPMHIVTKIRSTQPLVEATLERVSKSELKLTFQKPQKSVTAGQIAVFYKGNRCLGAGVIN